MHMVQLMPLCMYVCRDIYVRAAVYSLDCHGGAMIYRRLYKTFQSLVEHRTVLGNRLTVDLELLHASRSWPQLLTNLLLARSHCRNS